MAEGVAVPAFRYHPDPIGSGSAIESDATCSVCGESRGVVYEGPVYGEEPEDLCLTCIATGAAAEALAQNGQPAEFTDVGIDVPDGVPADVLLEVAHRTPGFTGWQQEHWLYHCDDACAFLGRAGADDLAAHPGAREMVLHENDEHGWTAEESEAYVESLHPEGDATAYLFRCLHCGQHLAYSDLS